MERLTKEQAQTRLRVLCPDASDDDVMLADIDATILEALDALPDAVRAGIPLSDIVDALRLFVAHKAHVDYEAGRAAEREACAVEVEKEYVTCDRSGASARQHLKWAAKHIRQRA
jgi:hypothetical protein